MAIHDTEMFFLKEIDRLKILQDVIDRNLYPNQAEEMLDILSRHCSRLLKRCHQSIIKMVAAPAASFTNRNDVEYHPGTLVRSERLKDSQN